MVIDDTDSIDPAGATVFRDVREVTGIGLPHPAEGIFLKSFPVPHVWTSCRLQVIAFNETLDGTDTDSAGNKAVPNELFMNLYSIETRGLPFQAVDFLDRRVRKDTGRTLIGTFGGHQGVDPVLLIVTDPFFKRLVVQLSDAPIWEFDRIFRDPLIKNDPGRVREEILDDRGDEANLKWAI